MLRWLVRVAVVVLAVLAGTAVTRAVEAPAALGAGAALLLALLTLALEAAAVRAPLDRLLWGSVGGLVGLLAGLAVGAAVSALLVGSPMFAAGVPALLGAYLGAAVALRRLGDLAPLSARLLGEASRAPRDGLALLDTSAIVDGRIADVAATGFLDGPLVVPRFVVAELQRLADSGDAARRARGRRGFEILDRLRAAPGARTEVTDDDAPGAAGVDARLVAVATARRARLVTTDHALQKVAELSGVTVLNVNELASALKPVALPGEQMQVQLLREGKEPGQGVAYLDDGTMVVVERGKPRLGQRVDVTVTSVLQTAAGRMIFGRLTEDAPGTGARHA
jgi:uncharacterized protein YacL